jgi:FKBP-type peptidyl-prolyl cis-trans isomerase 2
MTELREGAKNVCRRQDVHEPLVTGGFMHILRSAIPGSRSTVSIILLSLLMVPLIFIAEPSCDPQLSSSHIVLMRVSDGAGQESTDKNPSIAAGAIVFMEYTITIPESDLSIPPNLTLFQQGHQELLPNVEKALAGMKQGEQKRIDLSSDEAFGRYDESKRVVVSRDQLPADAQPGMTFVTEEDVLFVVVDLVGPLAEIDFNHPLAGRHVVIDVRILNIELPPDSDSEDQQTRPPDGDIIAWPRTDVDVLFTQGRSFEL